MAKRTKSEAWLLRYTITPGKPGEGVVLASCRRRAEPNPDGTITVEQLDPSDGRGQVDYLPDFVEECYAPTRDQAIEVYLAYHRRMIKTWQHAIATSQARIAQVEAFRTLK